jgi:SAM-dependent methyltransferase
MSYKPFTSNQDSHAHSLDTLNLLYEYDDFMQSIGTLADMGCGAGLDIEWWATRTTRDESQQPLNIKCTGIDLLPDLPVAAKHKNIRYYPQDFEEPVLQGLKKFDVIWCHDSFQFVIDPFRTLTHWHNAINKNGMLIIIVPQTVNMEQRTQAFDQRDGCYWNWTMVSLIHVLAVTGWDCAGGFFKKNINDPWLHAVVYRSEQDPLDPKTTRWYELAEKGLLPESAAKSVEKHGYLRQRDLVLPWLDKSISAFAKH